MRYGFRILGVATGRRRLVIHADAFHAYADCDGRAEVEKEAYLSAFQYDEDFRTHLETTGTTKGFNGLCWASFVWFDIDCSEDLASALDYARALASFLVDRYRLEDSALLLFFSGSKGFHLGLPTFWNPMPSIVFNQVARQFAEAIAKAAGVVIDTSVYDKVRIFRAPNSRHPKTGLHKRRLSYDELLHLTLDRIRQLAVEPLSFKLPNILTTDDTALKDWSDAIRSVESEASLKAQRNIAVANGAPRLNRSTLELLRDGAKQGDRHRLLFSAAANLAEFDCPIALAHALLADAGLDCGLAPSEVKRQIECGLAQRGSK